MTDRQKAYKKSLIKQLHISRRYREYYREEREAYEALLFKHFSVSSSKELQIDQLIALVKYFNFERETLMIQHSSEESKHKSSVKQLNTIRSIWSNYADDTSDSALLKFIKRQFKKQYLHVKSISRTEAQTLIAVLLKMQRQKSGVLDGIE